MTEKRFNVFDVDGTVFLEDHKKGSYHIGEKENVDIPCLNDIADRLNKYAEENEQLKSKNRGLQSELQIFKEDVTHSNLQINKLADENEQLKLDNKRLLSDYTDVCNDNIALGNENEQLKQSIQESNKAILQDMGILMSDEDVVNIRNDIADKLLKPLFKSNGFDVDIDTTDGFTIIPKGDVE